MSASGEGDLHRYFLANGGEVLHKWFHYFDIYERHFARFRPRPVRMLEIGVYKGGSLRMWQDYFHGDSTIVGIDIRKECKALEGGNIRVRIGSQDDPAFLKRLVKEFGPFDIVLDDGSHQNAHVIRSFETLYPLLSPTGLYMVEDCHTSYLPAFGGGVGQEGSMVEFFKTKIDELNGQFQKPPAVTDFTRATASITFYDSVIAVEKRPQGRRHSLKTHGMGIDPDA